MRQGGGSVAGTKNNLPAGLTNSNMLTTASADATTGIPAGTYDQITHTLASVTWRRSIPYPNHFYPVDCNQCHVVPAGNGNVTTGAAYTAAWNFPHKTSKMTNPSTCKMCHTNGIP